MLILGILANETPNFNELKTATKQFGFALTKIRLELRPKLWKQCRKVWVYPLGMISNWLMFCVRKLLEIIMSKKRIFWFLRVRLSFGIDYQICVPAQRSHHYSRPIIQCKIITRTYRWVWNARNQIPLNDKKKIDLEKMKSSIQKDTKLIYICNPNNPTGDLLSRAEIENFIKSIPQYHHFGGWSLHRIYNSKIAKWFSWCL